MVHKSKQQIKINCKNTQIIVKKSTKKLKTNKILKLQIPKKRMAQEGGPDQGIEFLNKNDNQNHKL